jgi:cell division protein FtsW
MVYSSSPIQASVEASSQTAYVRALVPKLILGLIGLAALAWLPYRRWQGRAGYWALGLSALALVLVILPVGLTASGRGTKRFLDLGLLQLQPAEFARLGLVIFLAGRLARERAWGEEWRGWWWPLGAIFGLAGIVAIQPNLSSALLLGVLGFSVLFLGGLPVKRMLIGVTPLLLVLPFVIRPYQLRRVEQFFQGSETDSLPYQVEQSLIALGSGGWTGKGLGEGVQKYFYLPFPHTDFILGVIGEELGFLGIVVLFALFGLVIHRGFNIARLAPDRFARLTAAGITISFAMNFLLHAAVALGAGPVTGVPLPFISHGGSALLVNLAAIGLLLSISRSIRKRPSLPRWTLREAAARL